MHGSLDLELTSDSRSVQTRVHVLLIRETVANAAARYVLIQHLGFREGVTSRVSSLPDRLHEPSQGHSRQILSNGRIGVGGWMTDCISRGATLADPRMKHAWLKVGGFCRKRLKRWNTPLFYFPSLGHRRLPIQEIQQAMLVPSRLCFGQVWSVVAQKTVLGILEQLTG